jgi:hypothetical protein
MEDVLMQLVRSGTIIPVCAVIFSCAIALAAIIAGHWHKVRQAELEAMLKHKMLDQGMSADDIQKVLTASVSSRTAGSGSRVVFK